MALSKNIIVDKIDNLIEYFNKYKNEEKKEKLQNLKQKLKNQKFKIAIVANMSAGKSTFINALFGKDVLPSYNEATTDCAVFIYPKPDIEPKAIIYFDDNKNPIEITENLEEEIKKYAKKDEKDEDSKYHNVNMIELYYPFKNIQTSDLQDLEIIFIDTPGPNNTDEFSQKHKDQSRKVLNEANLALFMFDYTQLDANLSSDEQGLWNTIKTRYGKDKDFDIFFLLNKIDAAFEDNFKNVKSVNEAKKNWLKHEKKAKEKLKEAAKKHGIKEPKVFSISSKFQLLHRDNVSFWDNPLESFQNKFKKFFEEKWEEEYINYMGINQLENGINKYINTTVIDKIFSNLNNELDEIIKEEESFLDTELQTLQKPQEDAQKALQDAQSFLDNEAKNLQNKMKEETDKIEKKYIEKIQKIINNAIEKNFNNAEDIAKQAIAFAKFYADGDSILLAKKKAEKEKNKIKLDTKKLEIRLKYKIDIKDIQQEMRRYINDKIEDSKRNYLDNKARIKQEYKEFQKESKKITNKYKKELEKTLSSHLNITVKNLKLDDENAIISFNIEIPNSAMEYNFKETEYKKKTPFKWWNPFTWELPFSSSKKSKTKKTNNEEHILNIYPKEIEESIKNNINRRKEILKKDIPAHKEKIKDYLKGCNDIFKDFGDAKQAQIEELQEKINKTKQNLSKIESRYNDFKKSIKG